MLNRILGIAAGATTLAFAPAAPLAAETFTLQEATIDQIQKAMADGALTSVELTSMYLNRIAIYDRSGIKLTAIPVIDPTVFTQAANADTLRASGTFLGPLHGIPFAAKDSVNVAGVPTSDGVAAFVNLLVPTSDAFIVTAMRNDGGVVLGKANMSTFASDYDGVSQSYGDTKNPYDLTRSPSGSSCGSAVATAANLVAFTIGGDTGGSIRQPASYSGSVGLKTSLALVSTAGAYPLYPQLDVLGPITRSVSDAALVMDSIADRDVNDLWEPIRNLITITGEAPYTGASYRSRFAANALQGKKIAVPVQFVGKGDPALGWDPFVVDPEILANFEQVKATLVRLGATVVEVTIPAHTVWNDDPDYEVYKTLNGGDQGDLSSAFDQSVAFYHNEFLKSFGQTLSTVFSLIPPNAAVGEGDLERWAGVAAGGTAKPFGELPEYIKYLRALDELRTKYFAKFADEQQIDAYIFPTHFKRPASESTMALDDYYINDYDLTTPGRLEVNELGHAAITVPSGFYEDGMPMTVSFMATKIYEDRKILAFANAFEQATKSRRAPALTPALPGETIEYSTALPPPSRPELNAPALRVAAGAKVAGKGKKATLVLTGGAVDASGLGSLTVYVNGKKIAAKKAKNWKASVKLAALRSFVKGSAKTVQVTVVAKDVYGNTSVTTKTVKLPKTA